MPARSPAPGRGRGWPGTGGPGRSPELPSCSSPDGVLVGHGPGLTCTRPSVLVSGTSTATPLAADLCVRLVNGW